HADGVLRRHRRDDARAEDAELVERLEIGLDPRAAARIGARDGEGDLHVGPAGLPSCSSSCTVTARPAKAVRPRVGMASNLQSTVRDLQRRKARGRRGLALMEGVRLVEDALAAGLRFRGAVVAPDLERTARGTALVAELGRHAVPVEQATARVFASLADTETPQGIIAVVEPRAWTLADIAWSGGGGGGAGAGKGEAGRADEGPIAVIVGNEGAGIRPQLNAVAAKRVAIPLAHGAESLNVAVAAGILLYEVLRGR